MYDGLVLHPFEAMFIKAKAKSLKRDVRLAQLLEKLGQWRKDWVRASSRADRQILMWTDRQAQADGAPLQAIRSARTSSWW
jgi:hypothetical protein